MKKSQRERVISKLKRDGFITRNECLSQYPAITRLSAIIQVLEEKGFEFEPKDLGNDWKYTMTKCPYTKTEYINPITKQIITTYK
jgi:hypothetical protein